MTTEERVDMLEIKIAGLEQRIERTESDISLIQKDMTIVKHDISELAGKLDTVLDGNSAIKKLLTENTEVSKGAKRNSIFSFWPSFISLVITVGKFLFF